MAEEQVINSLKNLAYEILAFREEQLKKANISFAGMFLVSYIGKLGPQKLSDLATRLGQSKSSITYIVDSMEEKGLLVRENDKNDRRVTWVRATQKAEEMLSAHFIFERTVKDALASVDPSKLDAAAEVIDLIAQSLNNERKKEDWNGIPTV